MKKCFWVILVLSIVPAALAAGKASDPYLRGRELYLQGQYQQAIGLYQKALKLDKDNWVVLQAIGDAYIGLQQRADALHYYQLALDAHPDNPTLQYFLSQPASTPVVPLTTPAPYPNLRTLEFTVTGGKDLLFPTHYWIKDWNLAWQESLYFGLQVPPVWSFGLQADLLEPSNDPGNFSSNLSPTQMATGTVPVLSGNLALVGKYYPFTAEGDFPLYLIGGGGVYLEHVAGGQINIWDSSNSSNTVNNIPQSNDLAPSLQWGLGIPLGVNPYSKLLLEYRMVNVFTDVPFLYGSFNVGGMIFF
jgi:hypothetical protein